MLTQHGHLSDCCLKELTEKAVMVPYYTAGIADCVATLGSDDALHTKDSRNGLGHFIFC